jgi:hypothetical protein
MGALNYGQWGLILDIIGVIALFISASEGAFAISFMKILSDAAEDTYKDSVKEFHEVIEYNKTAPPRQKKAAIKPKPYQTKSIMSDQYYISHFLILD